MREEIGRGLSQQFDGRQTCAERGRWAFIGDDLSWWLCKVRGEVEMDRGLGEISPWLRLQLSTPFFISTPTLHIFRLPFT